MKLTYGVFSKRLLCMGLALWLATAMPVPFGWAQTDGQPERFVSIDFNDVDINLFIKFIAELTEKNFVVDRRVRGKVTIISPAKISVEEAYRVFISVLEVHGFSLVESGEITKVIPAPDARSKNIETLIREEARSPDDNVVTQIVPLQYASPDEVKRLFAPLVSKSSVILSYQPTGTLIITDIHSNIKRLLDILKIIDVPGTGMEISVLPLENADATKMTRLLTTVFQQRRGAAAKGAATPLEESARFVADERTNMIVMLASKADSENIRKLVNRLDGELPQGNENIRVYYLENATAEELAETLQSLSQGKTSSAASQEKGKQTAPIVSGDVKITADKATNSLIIMAEKEEFQVIEDIIKKLDIPRSMVYIESLIIEVLMNKDFNLGTEWIAGGKTEYGSDKDAWLGGGWSGGGDSAFSNLSGIAGAAAATGSVLLPQGFTMGIFGETIEIGGIQFQNIGALIQAFRRSRNTNILSTPQLLTTDNEEATIVVGQNVPYQTRSGSTAAADDIYTTFEYRDVAISLKVTPQISKDRLIRLALELEVQKLASSLDAVNIRPTTLKRTVSTTVIVHDKNTIVIGGLIEDSLSNDESKIPCLGDLPGLGWAFKSMSRGREKTNLYFFLTPHVLNSGEEAAELYKIKKKDIDETVINEEPIKLYRKNTEGEYELPSLPEIMEQ